MDKDFIGIKNGTVYSNGNPIAEINNKISTYTKHGSKIKETTSAKDLVIMKRKNKEKHKESE